jgi:hypothetical protein
MNTEIVSDCLRCLRVLVEGTSTASFLRLVINGNCMSLEIDKRLQ